MFALSYFTHLLRNHVAHGACDHFVKLVYAIAAFQAGKPDRDQLKFGRPKGRQNPNASTTNKEKKKTKNFMMLRHKLKGKGKKSFSEKQVRK